MSYVTLNLKQEGTKTKRTIEKQKTMAILGVLNRNSLNIPPEVHKQPKWLDCLTAAATPGPEELRSMEPLACCISHSVGGGKKRPLLNIQFKLWARSRAFMCLK